MWVTRCTLLITSSRVVLPLSSNAALMPTGTPVPTWAMPFIRSTAFSVAAGFPLRHAVHGRSSEIGIIHYRNFIPAMSHTGGDEPGHTRGVLIECQRVGPHSRNPVCDAQAAMTSSRIIKVSYKRNIAECGIFSMRFQHKMYG